MQFKALKYLGMFMYVCIQICVFFPNVIIVRGMCVFQ